MDNITNFNSDDLQELSPIPSADVNDLIGITDNVLFDAKTDISLYKNLSVPMSQLSTLGAGVASLLPVFRKFTEVSTVGTDGLYTIPNAVIGDTLKVARNGNFWPSFKKTNKFAQLQKVDSIKSTNSIVAPINPATIMMAVALFSVEQQLGKIEEMQKRILSFLEIEKQSEIVADIETLSNIIEKYKYNWDNEQFIASNHKMVIDIQRTARKNMKLYQAKVNDAIKEKKIFVLQNNINSTLSELMKSFKYYRLSLFALSMSSLIEIMLSGNFKKENILSIKEDIQQLSFAYRNIYSQCSMYLEGLEEASVKSNLLKRANEVKNTVDKVIDGLPKIKDGRIAERLQEDENHTGDKAKAIEADSIIMFAQMSNPNTSIFTEKMDDLIFVFNQTTDICFDNDNIYLIENYPSTSLQSIEK